MIGHRQHRILSVLSEHPAGLAAENLLAVICPPGCRVERARMLKALRVLEDARLVSITGKQHRTEVAGALVRSSKNP